MAPGDGERRQVLANGRPALHEGQCANSRELVDEAVAGKKGAVANDGVAPQQDAIGQDDVIAKDHIVSHMTVRHQKIVRADDRLLGEFGGPMDGHVLAEDIAFSDAQASGFAFVFKVLWGITDDAAGVELIVAADGGITGEMDVRANETMRPNGDLTVDNCIGTDVDRGIKPSVRMNNGGGVNHV